jgi:feruloyl esterase
LRHASRAAKDAGMRFDDRARRRALSGLSRALVAVFFAAAIAPACGSDHSGGTDAAAGSDAGAAGGADSAAGASPSSDAAADADAPAADAVVDASADATTPGDASGAGDGGGASLACDDGLKALDLGPGAKVTLVKLFKAGSLLTLTTPAAPDAPDTAVDLCFVKVLVGPGNPGPVNAPSTSAGIGIEVFLPTRANWNARYQAFGSGGLSGGPEFTSLTAIGALTRPGDHGLATQAGYVVSLNDGGHAIPFGSFGMNPDGTFNETLFKDFAERASHEMVLKAKALTRAFYGKNAAHSYWNGCSQGGREGLMELQRHPEDVDAALIGAPAVSLDRLALAELWPAIVMQQDLGARLAKPKLALVTAAANKACSAALTGTADGYVTDPSACRYDPTIDAAILCAAAGGTNATAACLTKAEATAVNKMWYGPTDDGAVPSPATDNGRAPLGALAPHQLWFGLERGTLLADQFIWDGLAGDLPFGIGTDFAALVLGDPAIAQPVFMNATGNGLDHWKLIGYSGAMSFPAVFEASRQKLGPLIASDDPDLSAFAARGGKLLMWHGTADTLIPPQSTVRYYESVAAKAGGYAAAQRVARLYLAPGIDHCFHAGVPGTNPTAPGGMVEGPSLPMFDVLKTWVEGGPAPDDLAATTAAGVTPARARPWCLYPKKLKHAGGEPGTFSCE